MIPQFDSRTCCLHPLPIPRQNDSVSARIKLVEVKNKNNGFSKSWLSQKPIGKWSWDIMLSILQAPRFLGGFFGPMRHPKGESVLFFVFFFGKISKGSSKMVMSRTSLILQTPLLLDSVQTDNLLMNFFRIVHILKKNHSYIKAFFSSTTHLLRIPTSHHFQRPTSPLGLLAANGGMHGVTEVLLRNLGARRYACMHGS